jgi:hypothetical protein
MTQLHSQSSSRFDFSLCDWNGRVTTAESIVLSVFYNMVYLALHQVHGLDRPEVFSVPLEQPEVACEPFPGEHQDHE